MFSYQWVASNGATDTNIAAATASTYTLVAADAGKTIKVQVSFTDDEGNDESVSSAATQAIGPVQAPAPPTDLVGRSTEEGVVLSWNAPDGEVTGYQILRRRPRECEPTLLVHVDNTGNAETTYTDTEVMPEIQYEYRVKAINDAGIGKMPNFAIIAHTPPSSLRQSGSPGRPRNLDVQGTKRGAELDWDAPEDSEGITGYQILRRKPNECEGTLRILVNDTGSTATSYIDTDVEINTDYVYRVKAINDNGAGLRSNSVDYHRGAAVVIMMFVTYHYPNLVVGMRDQFEIQLHHLDYDDDSSTTDYVLRGDAYKIADDPDAARTNAYSCEMAGLGHDINIAVVDESAEKFDAQFGGSDCEAGNYVVDLVLTDGSGEHLITLPLEYTIKQRG